MSDRSPNWSKWKQIPQTDLWKAVALSLDIEPDKVRHPEHQWMSDHGAPRRFEESKEFQSRYDVAMARLSELHVTAIHMSDDPEITLLSFATLANACRWSLPDQFPAPMSAPSWTRQLREHWMASDLWSEADLQALCCGLVPGTSRQATAALNAATEAIRRAVLAKALPVASEPRDSTAGDRMYGHSRFFTPAEATRWAEGKFPDIPFKSSEFTTAGASAKGPSDLTQRAETTYLNIIGALLELILAPRPGRDSNSVVIQELIQNYGEKPGISKSTLEAKFAAAKKSLLQE